MKILKISIAFLTVAAFSLPIAALAATPAQAHLGQILLDTGKHGEAWYVSPQSQQRVFLGRPDEALDRLLQRAIPVNYFHVEQLAEIPGAPADAAYAKAVAGQVLLPNDLVGAAWYVDPLTGLRKRLASPGDAWEVMKHGVRVSSKVIASIPAEGIVERRPTVETVKVKSVLDGETLELEDGAKVRILNISVPANPDLQEAAMSRLRTDIGDGTVVIEREADERNTDYQLLRDVRVGDLDLGYDLVRRGLAFHDIIDPNFKYAEQLIVASMDAARLKNGFWAPK